MKVISLYHKAIKVPFKSWQKFKYDQTSEWFNIRLAKDWNKEKLAMLPWLYMY